MATKFVMPDHKPMCKIFRTGNPHPYNTVCSVQRCDCNCCVVTHDTLFLPGRIDVQSDARSRFPLPETEGNVGPVELVLLTTEMRQYAVTCSGTKKEINTDTRLLHLKSFVLQGIPITQFHVI